MASADELDALRRATDVPATDTTYTDTLLGTLIDSLGVNGSAAVVWREKAAKYAALVNTSEAGSSREMSALHDHAMKMQELYDKLAAGEAIDVAAGQTYTLGVERV